MRSEPDKLFQALDFNDPDKQYVSELPDGYIANFRRRLSDVLFVRHETGMLHNSYEWGFTFYEYVKNHDIASLSGLLTLPSQTTWKYGILASDELRSAKNACLCLVSFVVQSAQGDHLADSEQLYSICDACIQLVEETTSRHDALLCCYASLCIISDEIFAHRQSNYHYLARQAKEYVYKHFHERITVEMIARRLKVSVPYLNRIFKEAEHMTLKQYIQQKRIESAENLLRYSTDSIQSISQYLSFSSQSHFTEVFRRHTGVTPLAFRNQFSEQYRESL